jgi:signal transduction histidine kinase
VARAIWLVVAAMTLLVFVVASFHVYTFYLEPCATWTIDSSCERVVGWLTSQGFGVRWLALFNLLTVVLVGLPWMTVAVLMFLQRAAEPSGWLLSLALLVGWASDLTNVNVRHHFWWAVQDFPFAAQLGYAPHVIVYFTSFVAQVTIIVLAFLLPNGRFFPRWTLGFALAWTFYMMLETFYRYPFSNKIPPWFVYPEVFFTFAAPVVAVYALWYRYRLVRRETTQEAEEQRRQLKTILPSISVMGFVYFSLTLMLFLLWRQEAAWADGSVVRYLHDLLQNGLQALCALWFILALSVAIFRHRLFALDFLISRTLVYGGLSVGLLALYIGMVFGIGSLLNQTRAVWLSLLATALIALLFQPFRATLQKQVSRFLYGQRHEPYEVMRQVSRQLQALHPNDVLPSLVQTLHQTLRLPYVAITVYQSLYTQSLRKVEEGRPGKQLIHFPLVVQDQLGLREQIGLLEVSPRSYETLSESEERLIEAIARQIALGAHSLRLSLEVQASREKLVTMREEERRRLQRDLHDGLGTTLAVQTLKLGAVRRLLETPEKGRADALLQSLEQDFQDNLAYIRQLVHGLRPPLLDQLGLKRALEHVLCEQMQDHLTFQLKLQDVAHLPAAAEVASYFIITEAVTNVLRHAQATHCQVTMVCHEKGLELTIQDDGVGFAEAAKTRGVGLRSMRERCEELGGKLSVSHETQGTRVWAWLPLHPQGLASKDVAASKLKEKVGSSD